MKIKLKYIIIITIFSAILVGCSSQNSITSKKEKEEIIEQDKITLKLQQFELNLEPDEEDLEYENSLIVKNESINISGIKFENIDNGMLNEYQDKYSKVINYIKNIYPNFDVSKWNIMVNMYDINDGFGMIRFNYQIKDVIDTNKSILLTVNNIINKISFINMDFETDEEKLIELVNEFKDNTIQEKKSLHLMKNF